MFGHDIKHQMAMFLYWVQLNIDYNTYYQHWALLTIHICSCGTVALTFLNVP